MSYLTGITSDWLLRDSNLFFIKIVDIYVYNRRYIFVDVHMCVCVCIHILILKDGGSHYAANVGRIPTRVTTWESKFYETTVCIVFRL